MFTKIKKLFYYLPARFWLAGPLAFLLAIAILAAMPHWLNGVWHLAFGYDDKLAHVIFPVYLFPLIWAICFFYPLLNTNIKSATQFMLGLLLIHIGGLMLFFLIK